MQVFVGQTRSRSLIARLANLGFGEVTQRSEWPPRRYPWVLDNGAYGDWKAERPFNAAEFYEACGWAEGRLDSLPEWVVCPDRVAGGPESLAFSLDWLDRRGPDFPALIDRWYLAVQDGMTEFEVSLALSRFAGIFVGGTLPWKLRTGRLWVEFAHRHARPCHIGRVGTAKRVKWAREIGADSIDSCLPLFSEGNLQTFLAALQAPMSRQVELGLTHTVWPSTQPSLTARSSSGLPVVMRGRRATAAVTAAQLDWLCEEE